MIQKRKTKNGPRYDVRLRDPASGKEYSRTFSTRREAEDFEARDRADRSRGTWIDPRRSGMTFEEWVAHWQANRPNVRPKTRARDDDLVRLHLLPAIGGMRLGSIAPLEVQRLVNDWAGRFAPSTVRTYFAVLRSILNAAVDAEVIGRNPCRNVKLPAVEPPKRRVLEPEEVHRLADELSAEYRAMVYLGIELGTRWGECAALRVGSLDLMRRRVTIAEQVCEVRGEVIFAEPKTRASRRTVAISEPLAVLLADYLTRRGLTGADTDALLFTAPDGGPLRYSHFRSRVWDPACERAGLTGFTFHGLRRTSATAMLAEGVDLRTAQERGGWATSRMLLEVYAQATPESDRSAADRLGSRYLSPDETAARSADA